MTEGTLKAGPDALLVTARIVIAIFFWLLVAIMVVIGVALAACTTFARGEVLAEIAKAHGPGSAYWAVIAVLLLTEVLLYLGIRFLIELKGIVRSVDHGDPFEPENAERLRRMAWITVIAYAPALAIGALGAWVAEIMEQAGDHFDFDVNLGGGGILMILTLFILARVFRHGAAMREDLEGTV
jgi:hypothetical protein